MSARILVVEDRPDNQKLIAYLLGKFGYETRLADTGEQGVEIAQREDFDLVLCDIYLPGISGYEVARRLKADPRFQRVPVVAITALTRPADRDRVLAAGFDGHVPKAIAPREFLNHVQSFLATGHSKLPEFDRHVLAAETQDAELIASSNSKGIYYG